MVREIFELIVKMSFQATLMAIAVSLIERLFRDKIKPKYISFMWIMVFIRLIFPFEIVSHMSFFNIFRKSPLNYSHEFAGRAFSEIPYISGGASPGKALSEETVHMINKGTGYSFDISYLWVFGVIILLFVLFHYYYNLKIKLYKNQSHSLEQRLTGVFDEIASKTGIGLDTEMICSEYANAPFVFGFFSPVIVLPAKILRDASKSELEIIILHEAQHIKKNHYRIKFFAVLIHIIHFFNPFLFYFTKKLGDALELECDFSLADEVLLVDKIEYAEVLALTARNFKGGFITGLSFGQNNLKRRIELLLADKKFTRGFSVAAIVLIIALGAGFFTVSAENERLKTEIAAGTLADTAETTEASLAAEEKASEDSLETIDEFHLKGPAEERLFSAEAYVREGEVGGGLSLKNKINSEINNEITSSNHIGGKITMPEGKSFWVNAYQQEMTYDELREELPLRTEKVIMSDKIKGLDFEIAGCYLFLEYTDEDFLRAELCEKEEYKSKISFTAPWVNGKGAFSAKFPKGTDGSLFQNEPRILTVYIPKKLNAFDTVSFEIAMGYSAIYGINAEKLSIESAMNSNTVTDNNVKKLSVEESMGSTYIDFDEIESLDIESAMGSVMIECGKILEKAYIANNMGSVAIKFKEEPENLRVSGSTNMGAVQIPENWSKTAGKFGHIYGSGDVVFDIDSGMGSISIE
jgi:beta-lactamase regulating signal transducer with metallopeptidase domain